MKKVRIIIFLNDFTYIFEPYKLSFEAFQSLDFVQANCVVSIFPPFHLYIGFEINQLIIIEQEMQYLRLSLFYDPHVTGLNSIN